MRAKEIFKSFLGLTFLFLNEYYIINKVIRNYFGIICVLSFSIISTSQGKSCIDFLSSQRPTSVLKFPIRPGVLLNSLGPDHSSTMQSWADLNQGSFADYLSSRLTHARDQTMSFRFVNNPQWDKYRTFSDLAEDPRFGLIEALDSSAEAPVMISSGFAQKYLFGNLSYSDGKFRFRKQARGLNELIIIDQMGATQFASQAFGDQPMYGTLYSLKDHVGFQINADDSEAEMVVLPTSVLDDPKQSDIKSRLRQGTQVKYLNQVLSSAMKSIGLQEQYGRADVITDYAGAATTEKDFGAVLSQYNLLLKTGGHLFLALPIKKTGAHDIPFARFSNRKGKTLKSVPADVFFNQIPGFKLKNSYTFRGELFNDPVSSALHFAQNYSSSQNYGGEVETVIVILEKTCVTAPYIQHALKSVYESENIRHFILDRLVSACL